MPAFPSSTHPAATAALVILTTQNQLSRTDQLNFVLDTLGLEDNTRHGITGTLKTKFGITEASAKKQLLQHLIFCHRWINVLKSDKIHNTCLIDLTINLLNSLFNITSTIQVNNCAIRIINLVTHRDSYASNKYKFPSNINHLVTFLNGGTEVSLEQPHGICDISTSSESVSNLISIMKNHFFLNNNEKILLDMICSCLLPKDKTPYNILEFFFSAKKYVAHPKIAHCLKNNINLPPFVIYFLARSNEDETKWLDKVLSPIDSLFTQFPKEQDKVFLQGIVPLLLGSRDLYLTLNHETSKIEQLMANIAKYKTTADDLYNQLLPQIEKINSTLDVPERVSEIELKQILYLALMNQDIVMEDCKSSTGYLLNKILTGLKHGVILCKDAKGNYMVIIKPTISNHEIDDIPNNRGGKGSYKLVKTSGIALNLPKPNTPPVENPGTPLVERIVTVSKSPSSKGSSNIKLDPAFQAITFVDIKKTNGSHTRQIHCSEYLGVPFNLLSKEEIATHLESIVFQLCKQFSLNMMDLKMGNVLFKIIDGKITVTIIDFSDSYTFMSRACLSATINHNKSKPGVALEFAPKQHIENIIFCLCLILFQLVNNNTLNSTTDILDNLFKKSSYLYSMAISEELNLPPGIPLKLAKELNAAYKGELTLEMLVSALGTIFPNRSKDFTQALLKDNDDIMQHARV